MRIVHELYGPPQVGGGSIRPYSRPKGDKRKPVSGYVDEMLICTPAIGPCQEEAIYIGGDLLSVYEALTNAQAVLECAITWAIREDGLDPDWYAKAIDEREALSKRKPKRKPTKKRR